MSYNSKKPEKEKGGKGRGGLFGKLFSVGNDSNASESERELSLNELIDAENSEPPVAPEIPAIHLEDTETNEDIFEEDISEDDYAAILAAAVASANAEEPSMSGAELATSDEAPAAEDDPTEAKPEDDGKTESAVSGPADGAGDRDDGGSDMLKKIRALRARAEREDEPSSVKSEAETIDVGANTDVFEEYEYVVNDGGAASSAEKSAPSETVDEKAFDEQPELSADDEKAEDASAEELTVAELLKRKLEALHSDAGDDAHADDTEKSVRERIEESLKESGGATDDDDKTTLESVDNVDESDGEPANDVSTDIAEAEKAAVGEDEAGDAAENDPEVEALAAKLESATESADSDAEDDSELMFALGYGGDAENANKHEHNTVRRRGIDLRSDYNGAFGYRGEEYRSREQTEDIKRAYRADGLTLALRVVGSAILTLAIIIFELFGKKFGGVVSVVDYPTVHILVSMQLLLLLAAMSWRQLTAGLIGIFHFELTPHSAASAAVLVVLIYDALLAAITPEEFTLYNLPAALCVAMSVVYDVLDYARQSRAFASLSSWDGYCVLEDADPVALAAAFGNSSSRGREDAGINHAMRLRRGNFADGYFKHTNSKDPALRALNYVIAPVIALALVIFFISVAAGRGLVPSANTFTVMVLVALPVFTMIGLIYPLFDMTRDLFGSNQVLLGANDAEKFADVDAVIFDEEDVLGPRSLLIKRIVLCDGIIAQDVFGVLEGASAVFDKAGGALAAAFRRAAESNVSVDHGDENDAEIIRISDGGLTARACGRDYLIGNTTFMAVNGVTVNHSDYECDEDDAGEAVMYIAVDHEPALKLYLSYVIDDDFRKLAARLSDGGICPVMISRDPNLDDALLARLLGELKHPVRVIRDKLDGDAESETSTEGADSVDSGLVANGSAWTALVGALSLCSKLRRVSLLNARLSLAIMAISVLAAAFLGALGIFAGMNSIYVAIYQIVCVLPAMITSKLMQS